MRNVGLDNHIDNVDGIELEYNHERRNFDFLIGKTLRQSNSIRIGTIIAIEYSSDGYRHDNAFAITDTGKRFNCRKLGLK